MRSPHSPIAGIRQDRDRLSRENDDLRSSFDALVSQVAALTTSLVSRNFIRRLLPELC